RNTPATRAAENIDSGKSAEAPARRSTRRSRTHEKTSRALADSKTRLSDASPPPAVIAPPEAIVVRTSEVHTIDPPQQVRKSATPDRREQWKELGIPYSLRQRRAVLLLPRQCTRQAYELRQWRSYRKRRGRQFRRTHRRCESQGRACEPRVSLGSLYRRRG